MEGLWPAPWSPGDKNPDTRVEGVIENHQGHQANYHNYHPT